VDWLVGVAHAVQLLVNFALVLVRVVVGIPCSGALLRGIRAALDNGQLPTHIKRQTVHKMLNKDARAVNVLKIVEHLGVLEQRIHKCLENSRENWRCGLEPALVRLNALLAETTRQHTPSGYARIQRLCAFAAVVKDAALTSKQRVGG
jgi:hypothetical protein